MTNVAVVIPARNEGKHIGNTLAHLFNQTIKPKQVVVVNDYSTDNTKEIAQSKGAQVVDFPFTHPNWVTTPDLAKVLNLGLEQINPDDFDYTMILGSDHLLPKDYIEQITKRMPNSCVVASGSIENEYAKIPRGSGRIIDNKFFKSLGFAYPVNWGYESWLILKAYQTKLGAKYFEDIKTTVQRKTAISYKPIMYFHYGKSMRALGYTFPYTFCKAVILSKKNFRYGLQLIYGFVQIPKPEFYDEGMRKFTRDAQFSKIKQIYKPRMLKIATMRLLA